MPAASALRSASAPGTRRDPRRGNGDSRRTLLEAFTGQRIANIRYTDQTGARTSRFIEPHYLYYSTPVWYVLAWDQLRDDVRSFRVDRIDHIGVTTSTFRIRPPDRFVSTVELEARPI